MRFSVKTTLCADALPDWELKGTRKGNVSCGLNRSLIVFLCSRIVVTFIAISFGAQSSIPSGGVDFAPVFSRFWDDLGADHHELREARKR
jgi:hypothetical protein